jgi:hypothetical protein
MKTEAKAEDLTLDLGRRAPPVKSMPAMPTEETLPKRDGGARQSVATLPLHPLLPTLSSEGVAWGWVNCNSSTLNAEP